jgi:DNA-binding NarL/FixJ family response regulator
MERICCLVGATPEDVPRLAAAIAAAASDIDVNVALFDVVMFQALAPDVIVVNIDAMREHPLEVLAQLRFVLPRCTIIVFVSSHDASRLREVRNTGANAIAMSSSDYDIALAFRHALGGGD